MKMLVRITCYYLNGHDIRCYEFTIKCAPCAVGVCVCVYCTLEKNDGNDDTTTMK